LHVVRLRLHMALIQSGEQRRCSELAFAWFLSVGCSRHDSADSDEFADGRPLVS